MILVACNSCGKQETYSVKASAPRWWEVKAWATAHLCSLECVEKYAHDLLEKIRIEDRQAEAKQEKP